MYWGPYEYHVAHLRLSANTSLNSSEIGIDASRDGAPLESLDVWPYMQDTLSIAPRALVKYFNITSYPPCITSREPCQHLTLAPVTVFHMLDDLATAIQQKFFNTDTSPVPFTTDSNWVDRLHHFLFRMFTYNADHRLHTLYHTPLTNWKLNDSSRRQGLADHQGHRWWAKRQVIPIPFLATDAVKWLCDDPLHPGGTRSISMWDHMHIRIEELNRRYPDVAMDFTMFTSSLVEQTRERTQYVPSASYMTATIKVTTLVRGRKCDASRKCRTVFVDDYRYERSWVESNEDQWTHYLWMLRGSAQSYIWIRVTFLVFGCFMAANSEPRYHHTRLFVRLKATWGILLRIPGHTVVYSSWYPLVVNALAHNFDSGLVQMVGEFAWASLGGLYNFNLIQYVATASIQMRNIWMIALIWKVVPKVVTKRVSGRYAKIDFARVGLLSVRAAWIGCISWLTTFALMRALHFRNTDIVSVEVLPRQMPIELARNMPKYRNFVDYGPRFDLKCMLLAVVIAMGFGWFVKMAIRAVTGRNTAVFTCRTHYISLSAGRLWLLSVLEGAWPITLHAYARVHSNAVNVLEAIPSEQDQPSRRDSTGRPCPVCRFRPSTIHWRSTQGCPTHEPIFDVPRRSKEIWSMVRLTNIAAMTDPIVLFRLYVIGVPLYMYRVPSGQSCSCCPRHRKRMRHVEHQEFMESLNTSRQSTREACRGMCSSTAADIKSRKRHILT